MSKNLFRKEEKIIFFSNSENQFLVPKQIEQLFDKFHYKDGATIYGADSEVFCHSRIPLYANYTGTLILLNNPVLFFNSILSLSI